MYVDTVPQTIKTALYHHVQVTTYTTSTEEITKAQLRWNISKPNENIRPMQENQNIRTLWYNTNWCRFNKSGKESLNNEVVSQKQPMTFLKVKTITSQSSRKAYPVQLEKVPIDGLHNHQEEQQHPVLINSYIHYINRRVDIVNIYKVRHTRRNSKQQ